LILIWTSHSSASTQEEQNKMTTMMKQNYHFDDLVKTNILSYLPPPPPKRFATFADLEVGKWYKNRELEWGKMREFGAIVDFKITKLTPKTISFEYRTAQEYGKEPLVATNKRIQIGNINGIVCEYFKNGKNKEYSCFAVDKHEYMNWVEYKFDLED
jgi:hypothetical protein